MIVFAFIVGVIANFIAAVIHSITGETEQATQFLIVGLLFLILAKLSINDAES